MKQTKKEFQTIGGYAAIAQALSYVIGFAVFIFLLDFPSSSEKPLQALSYLIENKSLVLATMTLIYTLAALILLILVLALHDLLRQKSPILTQIATATGIIWSGVVVASGMVFTVGAESVIRLYATDPERAATVWLTLGIVQDRLGGGTEFLGGVWICAISWVSLRANIFSRFLNGLGMLIGIAGILSLVPAWTVLVDLFGLGQILWFILIGFSLLSYARDK